MAKKGNKNKPKDTKSAPLLKKRNPPQFEESEDNMNDFEDEQFDYDEMPDEEFDDEEFNDEEFGEAYLDEDELKQLQEDNFDDEEYGDANDEEAEGYDEEYPDEDLQAKKAMRLVDDVYLEKLIKNIRKQPGYGTVSKCVKMMGDCIAERTVSSQEKANTKNIYIISDPDVLNKLLIFCLEELPNALAKLFKVNDLITTNIKLKSQKDELLAKSYLRSIVNFQKELKNDKMLVYILKIIRTSLIKLFTSIETQYKKLLLLTINLFGGNSESMNVKLEVLLLLINFVDNSEGAVKEKIIKKCYIEFFESGKSMSWRTWEIINFTKNGIIELMTIDTEISYVILFSIIQKWAKILKQIQKRVKKDTISALYNWGTINSLRVCVGCVIKVAAGNAENKTDFEMLAYPLLEIQIGIINLYPSSSYIPCRLKLLEQILNLCENLDINCSVSRIFLDLQKSKEFMKRISVGKGEAKVDFDIYQKIPKNSQVFGDIWIDLFKRLNENIQRYFALTAEKVYATESAIFWVKMLRVQRKSAKDMEIKGIMKNQSTLLEQNYYNVDKIRVEKSYVPNDYLANKNFYLQEFQKPEGAQKKLKVEKHSCKIIQELNKLRQEKENMIKMKIDAEKDLEISGKNKIKTKKTDHNEEESDEDDDFDDDGELLNFIDEQNDLDEDELEEEDLGTSEDEEGSQEDY